MGKGQGFEDGPGVAQGLMRATWEEVNQSLVSCRSKYVVDLMARTTVNEPNPLVLLALVCDLQVSGASLSKEWHYPCWQGWNGRQWTIMAGGECYLFFQMNTFDEPLRLSVSRVVVRGRNYFSTEIQYGNGGINQPQPVQVTVYESHILNL